MSRLCEDWLDTFSKWTLPRSEAPGTFLKWTGLFTLASAIRRNVKIPKSLLGSWEVSPHLYILFIAPAGKARKSTTTNYAETLLVDIKILTRSSELSSQAALMKALTDSKDTSVYALIPEFGEFISKSGFEMYGFLTNLFDGKRHITASTISRGKEFAERPCINLLGATTPEWVADNMPVAVIGGGFASRVIFVFEDSVRKRQLFYKGLDQGSFNQLERDLIGDLTHISTLKGDFTFAPDAQAWLEDWYQKNADIMPADKQKMHGYFERKPAHLMKVAMLLHLAYSDELVLTLDDVHRSLALLQEVEKKMPNVFAAVGKNVHAFDMDRIVEFVRERGTSSRPEILRHFYAAAEPDKLDGMLTALVQMERLDIVSSNNGKPPSLKVRK